MNAIAMILGATGVAALFFLLFLCVLCYCMRGTPAKTGVPQRTQSSTVDTGDTEESAVPGDIELQEMNPANRGSEIQDGSQQASGSGLQASGSGIQGGPQLQNMNADGQGSGQASRWSMVVQRVRSKWFTAAEPLNEDSPV